MMGQTQKLVSAKGDKIAYATLTQFRLVTHFTTSEISDADVNSLIADADRAVVRLTTTEVYLEQLEGNIDSSNTDFRTKYKPIADAEADGVVDGDDVSVYYATYDDTTNFQELGSAQTVTSIQAETGIITMDTAPTTTTAEAGVFAIYRYDSAGSQSNDIRKLASCYYLAHMISNKNTGNFPDYSQTTPIAPYLRKDLGGANWIQLCYEALGLQDKLFLVKSDGEGLPSMEGF